MQAFRKAKELNDLAAQISALINQSDERVVVARSTNPVSVEEVEKRFREEAPRMFWLALYSGEFFKAFAIDSHFGLEMKASIVRHAMKSMNEEALHVLATCHHKVYVESMRALDAVLSVKPVDTNYSLHFPEDPVLSRMTPILVPIAHNGIPIDDNLKESFCTLLEQAFTDNTPFPLHDLPRELQDIVDEFRVKCISDISTITADGLHFLVSLPTQRNEEMEVKLPDDEVTCRGFIQILPASHQWLANKLVVHADALLESWLNDHSGPDLLFKFNAHFYRNKEEDLIFHASRLSVLSKFTNQLPVTDDLLCRFFNADDKIN